MKKDLIFLDRPVYCEEPASESHDKANRLIRDLIDAIIWNVGYNDAISVAVSTEMRS